MGISLTGLADPGFSKLRSYGINAASITAHQNVLSNIYAMEICCISVAGYFLTICNYSESNSIKIQSDLFGKGKNTPMAMGWTGIIPC
jgi:hypothetical protein